MVVLAAVITAVAAVRAAVLPALVVAQAAHLVVVAAVTGV